MRKEDLQEPTRKTVENNHHAAKIVSWQKTKIQKNGCCCFGLFEGYPIATGVIEGACRQVPDRMGITGARWSLCGAEAVLKLRSLKMWQI